MAVEKQYLKWAFIGLNIIYTIFGLVVFIQAIKLDMRMQTFMEYDFMAWYQAPLWPLVFGIFSVAGLGFHGALTGKKWSLISFITANVIGVVTMLTGGAVCAKVKKLYFPHSVPGQDSPQDGPQHIPLLIFNNTLAMSFVFAVLETIGIALAAMLMQPAY